MSTVINLRDREAVAKAQSDGTFLYIGRPAPRAGLRGSAWSNPYVLDPGRRRSEEMRVLSAYRAYIAERIARGEVDLAELRGKVLACWCSPKPCHGDVLVELLEQWEELEP